METQHIVDLLNDLSKINIHRIAFFEKAASSLDDSEIMLKSLFYQISDESGELKDRLADKVVSLGGQPTHEDTKLVGVAYKYYQENAPSLTTGSTKAMLESCSIHEQAVHGAYKVGSDHTSGMPDEIRHMVRNQQHLIKMALDLLKNQSEQY